MNIRFTDKGEVIRNLREEKGIGLRELARITDIDPGFLSKIENNLVVPTEKMMTNILIGIGYTDNEVQNMKRGWALEALGVK